ncbi:hypothetical protein OH77DRAFT_1419663 [Trametes cingulata]|nr:hypothetical protein OH77DRAFT_1429265 [Trametes cingulata]KAI0360233.1 hypothetical protein OH77DRAFT_1419663 [Trametes cingulata]
MSALPVVIIPFIPQPPVSDDDALVSLRDRVRAELRGNMNSKLRESASVGIPGAHLSYTVSNYARLVVVRYEQKLVGWPETIPFRNLSERYRLKWLQELLPLWNDGIIRFEPATAVDLINAARDPKSVHPNPKLLDKDTPARPPAVVVAPLVLHPRDLRILGEHPTSTRPSAAVLGHRPRRQRKDVKKARRRFVTNPDDLPPRLPRAGVKSARYVYDSDVEDGSGEPAAKDGEYWPVEDPIEEFRPVGTSGAGSCAGYASSEVEEIETASEGSAEEVVSEIEDVRFAEV